MTRTDYSRIAKLLHWAVALLIFSLLCAGFFMVSLEVSPAKISLYMLHKSFGILLLMLVALRLGWRWIVPPPPPLETHRPWEKFLARTVHVLLYAVLVAMPLSGWIMSSAGDFAAGFFGLFTLPDLVAKNETVFDAMRGAHGVLAWVILALVALHAAGAFKHHFIDRDRTLQRMTLPRLGLTGGAVLALFTALLFVWPLGIKWSFPEVEASAPSAAVAAAPAPAGDAKAWAIALSESHLKFTARQSGADFTGDFDFDGTIVFDPDDYGQGRVHIVIPIASIKTGSPERDAQILTKDWFDSAQFPAAVYTATRFTRDPTQPGAYVAHGKLTIRGVTLPVDLPFTLTIEDNPDRTRTAHMTAALALNRLDFGVGQGAWQDTQTVGNEVKINISVTARQPAL